jgi:hypothetical protein
MAKGENFNGKKGVPDNQGKMVRNGTPKTIDTGGHCDGGGSAELARAASSINSGNRKGGLPGL